MTLNSLGFDVLSNKMIHFKHILDHPCFTAEQPSIEESSFYTEFCTWVSSREDAARIQKHSFTFCHALDFLHRLAFQSKFHLKFSKHLLFIQLSNLLMMGSAGFQSRKLTIWIAS